MQKKESMTWRLGHYLLLSAGTLFAPVRGAKRKKKNEKNEESPWDSWDTMKRNNICIIGIPGEMKE